MAPKRPSDAVQQSGADKKRAKMRDSRTIPVAGQQGRSGGSAGRGNNGLPPTIDVDKFAQARTFEISAMQRSMKAAKEAGTQRAFQSLPRHLRRRAASHNIRRLPTRLRSRARFEVPKDAAKPKKKTRKMLGTKKKLKGSEKRDLLLRRQRHKIWLETHIWHAKRMHMTNIWGHRLAEKPTEKAFRSSYRASVHGALVHDASYFQYIELSGTFDLLSKVLVKICDPYAPSPSSKRYSFGTREYTTNLYNPTTSSSARPTLIGPATIIWDVPPPPSPSTTEEPIRRLLLRLHPTINKPALVSIITGAVIHDLVDSQLAPGPGVPRIACKTLENEFLTFEITGKRATEVVKAVLKPVLKTDQKTKEAWRKLSSAAGPGSVPSGMVYGFEIYDPRLSFPPKLDKSAPPIDPNDLLAPSTEIADVPSFWDPKVRQSLKKPRFTKKELDERRSKLLIPGTRLPALDHDDRIPILLTQRTLTPSIPSTSTAPPPPPMHGWTLTIPSGWGMAIFNSLVFSSSRIGGLRERFQQSYESGALSFPSDFPGTRAFEEWEARRESVEKGYYDRKPPAKRCNWAKVAEGTKYPWRAEMSEIVKDLWPPMEQPPKVNEWIVPPRVVDGLEALVVGRKDRKIGNEATEKLVQELFELWKGESADPPSSATAVREGLVRVRVTPCGKGTPKTLGLLYRLDGERLETVKGKVGKEMRGKGKAIATGEGEGAEDLCEPPKKEDVIGRITTGAYSLARGEGYAVGFLSLYTYLQFAERDLRESAPAPVQKLVLFRNRDGEVYRAATLEMM
ncbi:ribonucleases P/MRP protein subunit POP1-domain-containing protein [Leucosporidium creatinivorum]|uniref:Ribonucleases P/MRP protein subunit POP1-domain-containing protein n=1 Tax=Leucosporidium creatinivorum TaxID=106004 RepID=A0A1Y2EQM9_9BASI|nr:ribonucleases P/MRP protein subunit POP1-domain-containing protein [Leucosporidium creatinivorum]